LVAKPQIDAEQLEIDHCAQPLQFVVLGRALLKVLLTIKNPDLLLIRRHQELSNHGFAKTASFRMRPEIPSEGVALISTDMRCVFHRASNGAQLPRRAKGHPGSRPNVDAGWQPSVGHRGGEFAPEALVRQDDPLELSFGAASLFVAAQHVCGATHA
jgi:hypothetical protein